jgi:hypothetical protein
MVFDIIEVSRNYNMKFKTYTTTAHNKKEFK